MSYAYDPEIAAALTAALAAFGAVAEPERGDWRSLRESIDARLTAMAALAPGFPEVVRRQHAATAGDGTPIALTRYTRAGASPGSAVLYIHGGGMICGSVAAYDPVIAAYVAESGVPMLAVEYRLAPEHPHPTPVEDCCAALRWLIEHAGRLGVDAGRIGVMGDSAGGGIAAGVALLARDRGLKLARQILIYPMLDDRNIVTDPALLPFATWTHDQNFTGWNALLGGDPGTATVSPSAAPGRAEDLMGVAPAYLEVGELDILCADSLGYARRLAAARIPLELHIHPGAPHGFERIAPDSDVARRSTADRLRALRTL